MKTSTRPLEWAVHDDDGDLRARFAHPEDAASLVAMLGDGTTIQYGNKVVWAEGKENEPAAESYDNVANVCFQRANANNAKRALRTGT